MNTLDHIILVFTAPRSYSSMLTKCIYDCGAFVGDCDYDYVRNPTGSYENEAIYCSCFAKYHRQHKGSAYSAMVEEDYLKDKFNYLLETFTSIYNFQGYKKGAVVFKHTLYSFNYKNILSQLPLDKVSIVIPKRKASEIRTSYARLVPHRSPEFIGDEVSSFRYNFNNIINEYPEITTVIDTNKLFNKDYSEIKRFVQDTPFLQWDENSVDKCIEWDIKNKKGRFGIVSEYGEI